MRTKNKPSIEKKPENWKLALEISTLVLAIIGLIVGYKACRSNEEIAAKSGNFDRPRIILGLANFYLSGDDTATLIFCRVNEDSSFNICNLPLQISNSGEKTADGIKVVLEFPKFTELAVMDTTAIKFDAPNVVNIRRSISTNNSSDFITFALSEINPGVRIELNEPINFHKTEVITSVPVNDTLAISIFMKYAMFFNLSMMGKDIPSQTKYFSLTTILDTNLKQIVNSFVKKQSRTNEGKKSAFIFLPEKADIIKTDGFKLNQFNICKSCYYMISIQDTSPGQDMIVAFYDYRNTLSKIYVYDEDNNFKQELNINP